MSPASTDCLWVSICDESACSLLAHTTVIDNATITPRQTKVSAGAMAKILLAGRESTVTYTESSALQEGSSTCATYHPDLVVNKRTESPVAEFIPFVGFHLISRVLPLRTATRKYYRLCTPSRYLPFIVTSVDH